MSNQIESYLGAVQEHLRLRGMNPDRIGQHLEEIADHLGESGRSPVAEYGSPETLAQELADAEGASIPPLLRFGPMIVSSLLLVLGITLIRSGDEPAILTGTELAGLVPPAVLMSVAYSTTTAVFRDWMRGLGPLGKAEKTRLLMSVVLFVISMVAVTAFSRTVLGDREFGVESLRSWVAGALALVVGGALLWWTHRLLFAAPKLREGSPLRISRTDRRVTLGHVPSDPQGINWVRLVGLAALPVFMILLLLSRVGGAWGNGFEIAAFASAPLSWVAIWFARRQTVAVAEDQ